MFGNIFINRFKVLIRNKAMIFWTLVFPIILATLFNFAFGKLGNEEKFEPFDIAIINDENYSKEENFRLLVDDLSKDGKDKVFNVKYVDNKDEAERLLENDEIEGYIFAEKQTETWVADRITIERNIKIVVKQNGISQTILKTVIDNYYQTYSMITDVAAINPQQLNTQILDELNKENFKNTNNKSLNYVVVYFYTLIGMTCLYAGFFGVDTVQEVEANLSKRGARISISPVHKLKTLLISLLVAFVIQYVEMLVLLAFLIFVLGVDFGNQTLYILMLTFFGSIAGLSMGTLIGASNRKTEGVKTAILLAVTMICSFLAGMMVLDMKYIIAKNVPILAKINPVSMITDGFYSLYYYDTLDRYFENIISLIIFSAVMIILSYMFIRRKKYDNI